ncbi:AraC family transcriptional regulator [Nocardia carnea]|uniref:AraC family transcriptional regulator n=1 Tax=Nocardia carnea TaxID=37328 RepID=UPI002458DD2A|nr:helix-turn-helix transcriptional regulator [Nocardia carnea]
MSGSGYVLERVRTSDVEAKRDRPERWTEHVRDNHGSVGLAFPDSKDFNGQTLGQKVGSFQLIQFESDAIDYRRSAKDVRRDGDSSARLIIPLSGSIKLGQGDAAAIVHPNELGLLHWRYKMHLGHDKPVRALIMNVSDSLVDLSRAGQAPVVLKERSPSSPLIRSLGRQVRDLAAARDDWSAADFTVAFRSALSLLDGVLNPASEVSLDKRVERARYARLLMSQYARNPDITPEFIARLCGVTVRTLNDTLKESEGTTPGAMLRRIRLEEAQRRLSTPDPVNMDQIASEAGFTTTRRFRESYQREFKETPAQMRERVFGVRISG